jgi:hypothetical protein
MLKSSRLRARLVRAALAVCASVATTALAGCLHAPVTATAPELPTGSTRVLFIGNSLTYTNDLPAMVEALARAAGDTQLRVASVAFPDFALEDHWNEGTAPRWLRERSWEYVVMQQGSSALPASQQHLRAWTTQFAPLIRASGAAPVLLMVWPQQNRLFDFTNVLDSYRNAAASVNGIFAPAGDAWSAFGNYDAMYADGLHPTVSGTYLAALCVLERIRGIAPTSLPSTIPGIPLDAATVRALQQAAATALARNPRTPAVAVP